MSHKTLRDLECAETNPKRRLRPMEARAELYIAVGDYLVVALNDPDKSLAEPLADEEDLRRVRDCLREIVVALMEDAFAHLEWSRYQTFLNYALDGDTTGCRLDYRALCENIERTWGGEDIFIRRLSGGVPGSYLQALTALKAQARNLDTTIAALMPLKKRK